MRKIFIGLALAVSLILPCAGGAAPQQITASGAYVMGENDSPKIAKDAARQEAMRAATEKAGVYVESYSKTKNMELSADEVRVISGAVLKVLREQAVPELSAGVWKYTVTLTCEVDTDKIDLQAMVENRNKLEKLQQERDALKKQNDELLAKYKQAKGRRRKKSARSWNPNTPCRIFLTNAPPLSSRANSAGRFLNSTRSSATKKSRTARWPMPTICGAGLTMSAIWITGH